MLIRFTVLNSFNLQPVQLRSKYVLSMYYAISLQIITCTQGDRPTCRQTNTHRPTFLGHAPVLGDGLGLGDDSRLLGAIQPGVLDLELEGEVGRAVDGEGRHLLLFR